MLATIAAAVVPTLLKGALGAFDRYQKGEISREQMETELRQSMLEAFAEIEKAWAEAASQQFADFMAAAEKSALIRIGWAIVLLSQLAVLLWHQVGIPAYVKFFGGSYPSSGATVEWAYLLVGGCIGLGPLVFRGGSGKAGETIRSVLRR